MTSTKKQFYGYVPLAMKLMKLKLKNIMSKKGYPYEYLIKKRIEKQGNLILRLSVSGYADFIVLSSPPYLLEVKTTLKNKFYPSQREIKQFRELCNINRKYNIDIFYQIREAGWEKRYSLNEVKEKYFKKL